MYLAEDEGTAPSSTGSKPVVSTCPPILYKLQLATPRGQFWIANLLMEAASVLVSRCLYCIALSLLHIYYIIFF